MLELWNFPYSTHKNKFKVENKFSKLGSMELGEFGFYNLEAWKLKFQAMKLNFES